LRIGNELQSFPGKGALQAGDGLRAIGPPEPLTGMEEGPDGKNEGRGKADVAENEVDRGGMGETRVDEVA